MTSVSDWNLKFAQFLQFNGNVADNPIKFSPADLLELSNHIDRQERNWVQWAFYNKQVKPRRALRKDKIPAEMRENFVLIVERVCFLQLFCASIN